MALVCSNASLLLPVWSATTAAFLKGTGRLVRLFLYFQIWLNSLGKGFHSRNTCRNKVLACLITKDVKLYNLICMVLSGFHLLLPALSHCNSVPTSTHRNFYPLHVLPISWWCFCTFLTWITEGTFPGPALKSDIFPKESGFHAVEIGASKAGFLNIYFIPTHQFLRIWF